MDSIQGIGAAAGITIGKIQVIRQATLLLNAAEQRDPEHEWQRMLAAQQHSLQTMSGYHEQAQQRYSSEMAKFIKRIGSYCKIKSISTTSNNILMPASVRSGPLFWKPSVCAVV